MGSLDRSAVRATTEIHSAKLVTVYKNEMLV